MKVTADPIATSEAARVAFAGARYQAKNASVTARITADGVNLTLDDAPVQLVGDLDDAEFDAIYSELVVRGGRALIPSGHPAVAELCAVALAACRDEADAIRKYIVEAENGDMYALARTYYFLSVNADGSITLDGYMT